MVFNNNYHKDHKKPYRITRPRSLVIDRWETSLEDLEDLDEPGARWRRDTKLISEIVQLENNLGRELTLSDVYQKFGSRIDAINDVLPFLVNLEEGPN
jgi:hypothetical protein